MRPLILSLFISSPTALAEEINEHRYCDEAKAKLSQAYVALDRHDDPMSRGMYKEAVELEKVCEAKDKAENAARAQSEMERKVAETVALLDDQSSLQSSSAAICAYQTLKTLVMIDIKTAKKYAKISGVANLQELYDLGEQVRNYDGQIAQLREQIGRKPLACKGFVTEVMKCQMEPNDCSVPKVQAVASVVRVVP